MVEMPRKYCRKLLLFALSVMACMTFSMTAFAFRIEVTVTGHENGLLYFGSHYGPEYQVIDTIQTDSKGHAVFFGDFVLPQGVYFIVIPPKTRFDFLVLDDQDFSITTGLDNVLGKLIMTGTEKPDLFFGLQRDIAAINLASSELDIKKQYYANSGQANADEIKRTEDSLKNRRMVVYKYYKTQDNNGFLSKMMAAMLPPEFPPYVLQWQTEDPARYYYYYKDHYFDAVDFSDERLLRTPEFVFHRMLDEYSKFFLSTRVDSIENVYKDVDALIAKASVNIDFEKYIVSYLVDHFENPSVIGMDAVFVYLANNYFLNGKIKWADEKAIDMIRSRVDEMKYNMLGAKSHNLHLKRIDGALFETDSIQARYIILWFWERGCSLCDEQTPVLHSSYEEIKKMGAELIAINIQSDKNAWEDYVTNMKLSWVNACSAGSTDDFFIYYGTTRTPRLFILDSNKIIVAKDVKPKEIVRYLKYLDTKK
ncbi:MAG: redoxin domain-containing protein [Bacteroidales bacterium]|nr:redoxin domain-containing protein [Bacteroidales bacterium]HQP04873.1 thioredoxin family protein [Bacteroidales bacterium]